MSRVNGVGGEVWLLLCVREDLFIGRFDESCICYSYDLYLYARGLGNLGRERKIEFDRIKRKLDIRHLSIFERNILYEWLFVSSRRSVIFLYMKMFYI